MYCGQNETQVGDLDVKVGCRSKQQCPASLQFSPGFTKDLYGRILQQLIAVLRGLRLHISNLVSPNMVPSRRTIHCLLTEARLRRPKSQYRTGVAGCLLYRVWVPETLTYGDAIVCAMVWCLDAESGRHVKMEC